MIGSSNKKSRDDVATKYHFWYTHVYYLYRCCDISIVGKLAPIVLVSPSKKRWRWKYLDSTKSGIHLDAIAANSKGVGKMTLVEFIFIPKQWSYPAKIIMESESLRKKRRPAWHQSRGSALLPLPPAHCHFQRGDGSDRLVITCK